MTTEILKDYIIYKIYCKNNEITDEYYGHTSAFRARKCHHKGQCNNETNNTEKYKIIRLNKNLLPCPEKFIGQGL